MADVKQEDFDLESVYDTEVYPLMERVLAICKRNRMPVFASFAYRFDAVADDTSFCTSHLQWPERCIEKFHEAERAVYGNGGHFLAMTITSLPASKP